MGRCKSLGLLKSFLSYVPHLSGASILCFPHPELPWVSLYEVAAVWWVVDHKYFSPSWVPLGLTSWHWKAVTTADCDIFVYWYGGKYFISQKIDLDLGGKRARERLEWWWQHFILGTPWTAACQASLSITNSWGLLKLMSFESVMTSNHLILCCPLLLSSSIFPSIRVFSNESALTIRWPKYWSFSFNISPFNEHSGLILEPSWSWFIMYPTFLSSSWFPPPSWLLSACLYPPPDLAFLEFKSAALFALGANFYCLTLGFAYLHTFNKCCIWTTTLPYLMCCAVLTRSVVSDSLWPHGL